MARPHDALDEPRVVRPNIALITPHDPDDRRAFSGTAFSAARALRGAGLDVDWVGPRPRPDRPRLRRLWDRVKRKVLPGTRPEPFGTNDARKYAREIREQAAEVDARLRQGAYLGAVALVASHPLAFTRTDLPIVHVSDAVFSGIVGLYPEFAGMPQEMKDLLEHCERLALAKAARCCFSSDWAAMGAMVRYRVPREKIRTVAFGPNIDTDFPFIPRRHRPSDPIRLLFLAKEGWERKGGPTAIACCQKLRSLGVDCRLTILGMTIPNLVRSEFIENIGYLDKNDPDQYRKLRAILDDSHLLFLATEADATPIVLCEAACYGLPAVTRAVGGVRTLVEDGVTGRVLPKSAKADAFAEAILEIVRDENSIARMSVAARSLFETKLNWDTWASGIVEALDEATSPGRRVS
jgi:glycosyltransferase involved in cell wall biosynthesis